MRAYIEALVKNEATIDRRRQAVAAAAAVKKQNEARTKLVYNTSASIFFKMKNFVARHTAYISCLLFFFFFFFFLSFHY